MPDDQSAPDRVRHWDYPEPREPSASFFWAAFLLLIAAWIAFEHPILDFLWLMFLWGGVAALWYWHKARENYEIDKLQFQLAYDRWWSDQELRNAIRDLDATQTKWRSLIEFLKFLLKLGMMVFVVWIICNIGEGRWGKPDFSKKDSFLQFVEKLASWLYGIIDYYAINYPIPYLIFRWTFIISFISFVILGLAFMIFELYRSFKLVKKREWRKLIDEQGDSYALFVGGAIGYFLFRWVWGEDYPWFGLSQFGVPLPLAGGIGAAVLFIGIKQFIGDWVPAFAPSPKREPEEDDPLPLPDAISLEGPQAEDVGSNDPTTQEAKHDTKQKGVIDNDGRRNSWGTNVEVRVMVMARTIAIWIFGLLASAPSSEDWWGLD